MKTFLYILVILIWLFCFTIGCMLFAQYLELPFIQEVIVGVLFVGSLIFLRIKKFQPSWMNKLED